MYYIPMCDVGLHCDLQCKMIIVSVLHDLSSFAMKLTHVIRALYTARFKIPSKYLLVCCYVFEVILLVIKFLNILLELFFTRTT